MVERSSATVAALSNLAMKDGTHIALDHEDTSQGALHSFQVLIQNLEFVELEKLKTSSIVENNFFI